MIDSDFFLLYLTDTAYCWGLENKAPIWDKVLWAPGE